MMSIIAKATREPLAPRKFSGTASIAEAEIYDPLVRELELYSDGDILGRSFLISGHRGSGKTTLVRKAIEDVSVKAIGRGRGGRPFPVELHGPNLLDPRFRNPRMLAGATADNSPGMSDDDQAANSTSDILATQQMLSQITVELYRALAREFGRAYGRFLEKRVREGEAYPPQVLELAGQLTLELDDGPSPEVLREFWRQAGALETGVLFPEPARLAKDEPARAFSTEPEDRPRDQGVREVVALATAASAYRRVSGVYEGGGPRETRSIQAEQEQTSGASTEQAAPARFDLAAPLNNLLGTIAGIAAGAGVFFGTNADNGTAEGATVGLLVPAVGIMTALATTYGLHRVQSQKRSLAKEYTFIRDHSISTLDRELPNLIDRVRAAGMSPVFVVDELDKVRNLPSAMNVLVQNLKHIVTERCFFCFLTDRNYFEYLRAARSKHSYSKEYTYFTEHLFLSYRPKDLHDYLKMILVSDDGEDDAHVEDLATLRHLILFRARLHPFDIQTEIALLSDKDGRLRHQASDFRSLRDFRLSILIQLGVECLIETGELKKRLTYDPYFVQVAYDAMYYPARRWEQNLDVDLSFDVFARYLRSRTEPIAPEIRRERELAEEPQVFLREEALASDLHLRDEDIEFLCEQVRHLLSLLENPARFARARESPSSETTGASHVTQGQYRPASDLTKWWSAIPPQVVRAVGQLEPLVSQRGPNLYVWNFDAHGQNLREESLSSGDIMEKINLIDSTNDFIKALSDNKINLERLADIYGVVSTTPGWPTVESAIERTREGEDQRSENEAVLDREAIEEYTFMLGRDGDTLGVALLLAADIGRGGQAASSRWIERGLEALADLLDLPKMTDPFRVDMALRRAWAAVDRGDPPNLRLEPSLLATWCERINELLSDRSTPMGEDELTVHREHAWETWRERVSALFTEEEPGGFQLKASDLYCQAAGLSPSALLRFDLDRMTLATWSEVLTLALEDIATEHASYAPRWFVVPALVRLGLGAACVGVLDQLQAGRRSDYLRRKTHLEEIERAREFLSAATQRRWTRSRRSCCVVSQAHSPMAASWLPSARSGAILLTPEQWHSPAQPLEQMLGVIRSTVDLTCVMVDVGDQPPTPAVSPPSLRGVPIVYLAAQQPTEPNPSLHTIVAPRSLDAAMGRALQALR